MTHYDILGVSQDAIHAEIRGNYRRLVKQYHPDLNPSAEARELIVKITEAYEILSDPFKRQSYDWLLLGLRMPEVAPEPDEREIRRQEYIRNKRIQEQQHWEHIFQLKVKFYKVQRYFAFLFLIVALAYSYDYFFTNIRGTYPIKKIAMTRWGSCNVNLGFTSFETDGAFFHEAKTHGIEQINVHYSSLFDIPVGISADHSGYYHMNGTLHSFNNFFAYLLLILGLILAINHQYSDWSLTLGLVPFFITAFLFLLTYTSK